MTATATPSTTRFHDPVSVRAKVGEAPPTECPTCGDALSEHPYDQDVLRPSVRRIRRFAAWLIPFLFVAVVVALLAGTLVWFHLAAAYAFLTLICLPSLVLYWLTRFVPLDRRVICLRCSWYRDYPQPWPTADLPARWKARLRGLLSST